MDKRSLPQENLEQIVDQGCREEGNANLFYKLPRWYRYISGALTSTISLSYFFGSLYLLREAMEIMDMEITENERIPRRLLGPVPLCFYAIASCIIPYIIKEYGDRFLDKIGKKIFCIRPPLKSLLLPLFPEDSARNLQNLHNLSRAPYNS